MAEVCNIAHRGASADAPENTLEAFGLALDQGADMIETDLHLMQCGEVALYHDDRIDGVVVGTLTLAQLRERLPATPTLEEALDAFGKRMPFNLEFKSPGRSVYEGLEQIALDAVRSRGILENTLFSSFNDTALERLRELEPQARIGVLVSPRWSRGIEERAARVKAEACNLYVSLATRLRTADLHDAGYKVNVYTVDDPDAQAQLIDYGVDGIFTNVPGKLRAVLNRPTSAGPGRSVPRPGGPR